MNQHQTLRGVASATLLGRTRLLSAFALFVGGLSLAAFGQQAAAQPANNSDQVGAAKDSVVKLEAFVATGSRFNNRTVTESPVPIDVISGNELQKGGYTETAQMIQAQVPSFNFPRPSLTDGTDHIRPATLRGLAPDQVLLLVNGKRRHTSSLVNLNGSIGRGSVSTDFNALPAAAIGRIEVLRDGASAQYGSDAIAGVINVILRHDQGWGGDISYGQTGEGDGEDMKINAFAGTKLGDKGNLFISTWTRDKEPTNRSLPDTRQQYFGTNTATGLPSAISGNYGSGTGLSSPGTGITLDPREQTINRINHRFGDPMTKESGAWFNGEYELSNGLEAYFFGGFSKKHANGAGFARRPGDDRTVRAIYPNGFLPFIQSEVFDASWAGGVQGKSDKFDWDLSSVYGYNTLDYRTAESANVTLGNASPTSVYSGQLKFKQWTTNFDVTSQIGLGLATPAKIAGGLEFRKEDYSIGAGEPDSYRNGGQTIIGGPNNGALAAVGMQVFPGFKPSDAGTNGRDSKAVYVDLEQDLSERLVVSAAGRFEDYSDFGSSTTAKLASRFKVTSAIALRGSVSSGFRAPHLAQSWFSSTATNFIGGVPFDILTFPVSAPGARALGSAPLTPEKSNSVSFGGTWNPTESISVTVDAYRINIDDRIVLSSNFTGTAVVNLLASQGITGIGGGRYFTNAVDTETKGFDVSGRYTLKTDNLGKFTFTANYNNNKTKATRVKQANATLAAITTTPLFDLTETIRLERGQPRDAMNLIVNWEIEKWSFQVRHARFGDVSLVAFSNATPAQVAALTPGYATELFPAVPGTVGGTTPNQQIVQTFGAKWLTDLDVSYKLTKNITLSAGANNLFDVYPDENIRSTIVNGTVFNGSDNVGIFPYNSISPFGFNGVTFYGKVAFRF
jgi:iron complex outermembrane receptor protein